MSSSTNQQSSPDVQLPPATAQVESKLYRNLMLLSGRAKKCVIEHGMKSIVGMAFAAVAALVGTYIAKPTEHYASLIQVEWQETVPEAGEKPGDPLHFQWTSVRCTPDPKDPGTMELLGLPRGPVTLKFAAPPIDPNAVSVQTFRGIVLGRDHKIQICEFEARITTQSFLELFFLDSNGQTFEKHWFRNPNLDTVDCRGLKGREVR